jgi:hypothetical protein
VKPFVRDVLLFVLIQAGIALGMLATLRARSQSYLAMSVDKERRLATVEGSRIVFVGGSSCAFGLDSGIVEARLGRPPVNMGLFAPLGAAFMLAEVRADLRRGDLVVVSLEYEHYRSAAMFHGMNCKVWRELFMVNPAALRYASWHNYAEVLSRDEGLASLADLAKQALKTVRNKPPGNPFYARSALNVYGDIGLPREDVRQVDDLRRPRVGLDEAALRDAARTLQRFADDCAARQIEVILAMPSIPIPHYEANRTFFEAIEDGLRRETAIPIILGGREACLPIDCFFDTCYHLTTQGTRARSLLLCDRLEAALAQ